MIVDCHAHAWSADGALAGERSYTPSAARTVEDYLSVLDANGITHGVLVQPSFLGTDNAYLTAQCRARPDRLRGVAVVDPDVSDASLQEMDRAGVVAIRLNLLTATRLPDFEGPDYRALYARIARLGWHVEAHAGGELWPRLIRCVTGAGLDLVCDHFGKPDPERGLDCPGFRAIVDAGPAGRIWGTVSGFYRQGGRDVRPYADALLAALGPDRLLWASDYPFTRHEHEIDYPMTIRSLAHCVPDAALRQRIQGPNAARRYRIPQPG